MTIDKATLEQYRDIMGDEYSEFALDIIDTFLESSPKTIIELRKAFKDQDAKSFERAAHTLKSNANLFGANKLSEIALDLENLGKSGETNNAAKRINELLAEYTKVIEELNDFRNEL